MFYILYFSTTIPELPLPPPIAIPDLISIAMLVILLTAYLGSLFF